MENRIRTGLKDGIQMSGKRMEVGWAKKLKVGGRLVCLATLARAK